MIYRKACFLSGNIGILKDLQVSSIVLIAVLLTCFLAGYSMCYGKDKEGDLRSLFEETQRASVFYLDNGMEVILAENHASPMIAAVAIVKVGSRNENAASNGTAHFLEHLMFNGTATRTQKQIYDEMDFYGGYNNAHTTTDHTNYIILMPKEYIAQGMDIQADMLFNSILPEEKFEKERGIVIEEIGKSANSPDYQVHNHLLRVFYAGTPYERPVLGTVSTISNLKRGEVLAYYKTWYVPNNMSLMVIGDFSTQEMLELVKEKYGKYPPGPVPEEKPVRPESPPYMSIAMASGTEKFPEDRHYLNIGYILPPPASIDLPSLELLAELLGGKENAVLQILFEREEYKDLLNSISASMEFNRDFSTLRISAELPLKTDVKQVVDLILQAVHGMAEGPVPADDVLSSIISRQTGDIYLQEKPHYYAMMKSGFIAAGGYPFLRSYTDGLMHVTPLSIQRAAARHLKYLVPAITLMSPMFRADEAQLAGLQNIYHMETLENGLTVALKVNKDSRVIGVHLLAKGRNLSEGDGKWGMAEVLQRMFIEGGTDVHPGKELYRAFESIGAELKLHDNPYIPFDDYYNSPRFAYIRFKVVDTFFEKGMELLAEMILRPQLTVKAFEQAKKQVLSLSRSAALSTPVVANRLLYDNLFVKNPGFGWLLGTPAGLEQLQLKDVLDFYNRFYNPSNLIIVVSGNQPVEKVMGLITQYFGGTWGKPGWQPPLFIPQFSPLGRTIHEKMGKPQSYIAIANTFEIEEKDRPVLDILGKLFSDRLAFNLREKQGLAYTISMYFQKYQDARWYCITMGTRPENIGRAVAGIKEEIDTLRKTPFGVDEVRKAINSIIGWRGMRRLDRVNQAYYMSMEILEGRSPEADEQFNEALKTVTQEDLGILARKVFQDDAYLTVIVE